MRGGLGFSVDFSAGFSSGVSPSVVLGALPAAFFEVRLERVRLFLTGCDSDVESDGAATGSGVASAASDVRDVFFLRRDLDFFFATGE